MVSHLCVTTCVTVPEFLKATAKSFHEIAEACGVHVSQVYRWAEGKTDPAGMAMLKLVQLSDGEIRIVEKKRRTKSNAA